MGVTIGLITWIMCYVSNQGFFTKIPPHFLCSSGVYLFFWFGLFEIYHAKVRKRILCLLNIIKIEYSLVNEVSG